MTGAHGRAASVAWLSLNPVEREDYRQDGLSRGGGRRAWHRAAARSGASRRAIDSRVLEAVGDDLSKITAEHVLAAARAGDGVSISVMRDTAKYLGMAAANLVLVVDPEMLVLGGIMADAADLLLEPVRTEIGRRLPRSMTDALAIATATLGVDAAAIGAARQAAPRTPMIVLSGAALVLPDRMLSAGTLVIEDGRITEIRPDAAAPHGPSSFAFHGHYIVPGFIDVHVHGVDGADSQDPGDPIAFIAGRLPKYGVTAFCPTTVACPPGMLRQVLDQVRRARETPRGRSARVLPAHLESNFINAEYRGAQPSGCLRSPQAALCPP